MLVHQSYFCRATEAEDLKKYLLPLCKGFKKFDFFEDLNSWHISGFPDLVVMEGSKIKPHDDGGRFWQPMLVLENCDAKWIMRGAFQKVGNLIPQVSGTFIVLDIQKKHCVSGRSHSPWMVLCWNPQRSVPQKQYYDLEDVIHLSKKAFLEVRTLK
jgi:hypothetical protein